MYSLIKAQLQLENDDPNIYIKDKKELKYFCYYNYNIFFWISWMSKQLQK